MMKRIYLTPLTAAAYMSGDPGTTIKTPVGRIVWGHPCKARPATDDNNNPKLNREGKPVMEVSFGLAIPEAEFHKDVWPHMAAEIAKGYPNGIPGNFSYKMRQPHEIDNKGKPFSEREGYAGHVVLAVSTQLEPPPVFQWDGAKWVQMQPEAIKCGDYVQVEINFKVNVPDDPKYKPSIYVNPRQIAFVGYGQEIKSGVQADPNATFGAGPAALPPGASATPIGGAPNVGMPGAPAAGGMPGQMPGNSVPATMPGVPSASPVAAASPSPVTPAIPAAPQRPTDPTHVHDNGNGTEQWFVNGAWDGGQHPIGGPGLPPPATGFVQQAAGMPGMPGAAPAAGMPGAMPPR